MSYVDIIKKSFQLLIFNHDALVRIVGTKQAVLYGWITLLISGIFAGIREDASSMLVLANLSFLIPTDVQYLFLRSRLFMILLLAFLFLIIVGVTFFLYHFLAKFVFGGKATWEHYFRAFSNSYVFYWFIILPFIDPVIIAFVLALVNIFIIYKLYQLSLWKAVAVAVVIPLVIIIALQALILGSLGLFNPGLFVS